MTANPTSSPSHSIGSSDGRCVQRAGTYSAWANDPRLRGIPSCTSNSHKARSPARMRFHRITQASRPRMMPIGRISVARVRPRTSKGITDLLLPDTSTHYSAGSPHDWARASFPDQSPHMRQTPAEGDEPPGHEGRSGRHGTDANHTFWSRSLSESTRRINPRTKNGHAPPPMKS